MSPYEARLLVRALDAFMDARTEATRTALTKVLEAVPLDRNYRGGMLHLEALHEQHEKEPY